MGKLTQQELKFWIAEGKACEDRQKTDLFKRNNYPFLIQYYEGVEKINALSPFVTTAESYAIINEFFPNTNAKISELMYKYPDIVATATHPDAEGSENLMKSALGYAFSKADALIENRVALFDMLYAGYCAVEVDHIIDKTDRIEGLPNEDEIAKRQEDSKGLIQKTMDFMKGIGTTDQVEEEFEGSIPKKEEAYATNEKTYIKRWNPVNIPLDYRAEVLKDRRYNLKKIELTKAEFNARFPDFKDKINASDNTSDFDRYDGQDHKRKILLYEFQIKKRGNEYWNLVVCPSYPVSELELWKRPYIHNGFNVKIGTLHKYGKLYPVSFAQINKKMQDEMNHYVKFLMECAERTIPKYIVDKNKVKQDGLEALRSNNVNDIVMADNTVNAILPTAPSVVSRENKDLLAIFTDQKQKLWNVSQSKLSGVSNADFATEINIQEMGNITSEADIQEGLRLLMKDQLEALKDIIVSFWDGEYFFKVTGGPTPQWYAPQTVPNPLTGEPMIMNALTDILTGDYELDLDILSAQRPNKDRKKKETVEFLTWCINVLAPFLVTQGKTINIDDIKKAVSQFGMNPETFIIDLAPQGIPGMAPGMGLGPEGIPPEMLAQAAGQGQPNVPMPQMR